MFKSSGAESLGFFLSHMHLAQKDLVSGPRQYVVYKVNFLFISKPAKRYVTISRKLSVKCSIELMVVVHFIL